MKPSLAFLLIIFYISCFSQQKASKTEIKKEFDFTDTIFYPGQYKVVDLIIFNSTSFERNIFSPNKELDSLIILLTKHPNISIKIESHTDFRGDSIYNDTLSLKRSKALAHYLFDKGIIFENIIMAGYGEKRPRVLKNGYTFPNDFYYSKYSGINFPPNTILSKEYIMSLESSIKREAAHLLNRRTVFLITKVE